MVSSTWLVKAAEGGEIWTEFERKSCTRSQWASLSACLLARSLSFKTTSRKQSLPFSLLFFTSLLNHLLRLSFSPAIYPSIHLSVYPSLSHKRNTLYTQNGHTKVLAGRFSLPADNVHATKWPKSSVISTKFCLLLLLVLFKLGSSAELGSQSLRMHKPRRDLLRLVTPNWATCSSSISVSHFCLCLCLSQCQIFARRSEFPD